jgi:hypothetical protein
VASTARFFVLEGSQDLEVVGESFYQDALWIAVGGRTHTHVRHQTTARLLAEQDNEHDANAISVWIDDRKVGHLCRDDAAAYRPGVLELERARGGAIGLRGTVVGGGPSPRGGEKYLGVWLAHDPVHFGLEAVTTVPHGQMRTGLTEAMASDLEDDSYDLSWWHEIPEDQIDAIAYLRGLLVDDPDPIDRHYMFAELEWRLYRHRDELIEDYDETCLRHDAEMDGIREAMMTKWGQVPIFETYRQATIRWYKAKEFEQASWWAERGLSLYGDSCARPEAVEDLRNRADASKAKMQLG